MLPFWQHRGWALVAGISCAVVLTTVGSVQQLGWSLHPPCDSRGRAQFFSAGSPAPLLWRGKVVPQCGPQALAAHSRDSSFPIEAVCEATPWLLPARTKALPYTGVKTGGDLLALRAKPFGGYSQTISIFFFNRAYVEMTQNYVYSLVRFAGVRNYVAATWSSEDYAACLALNLPCWDVSSFLPGGKAGSQELLFGQRAFHDMGWTRTAVAAHLVKQGYAVHLSDVDISYSPKPLWDSYLRFLEDGGADVAGAAEGWGINTGNYVVIPSPAGKAFMRAWAEARTRHADTTEQWGLDELHRDTHGASHATCVGIHQCRAVAKEIEGKGNKGRTALIRMYPIPHTLYHPHGCWMAEPGAVEAMPIDPCHFTMAYLHPICQTGAVNKTATMRATGFWFMGDDCSPASSAAQQGTPSLARCRPLAWSQPQAEDHFWRCREHPLAFTYVPPDRVSANKAVAR